MSSAVLRRVLHASSAALALTVFWSEAAWRIGLAATAAVAVLFEVARLRVPTFREWVGRAVPAYRDSETYEPSGAMWLAIGYALAGGFPTRAAVAGVLAAAWADPAASLIGGRWGGGRTKSVPGSLGAFAVACGAIALTGPGWFPSVVGGAVAAALERWSRPLNDNLVIAPGVAAALWLLA